MIPLPCGSTAKESARNAGGLGSIPGLGRSPGEGTGYPFQYSGLENSMGCTVHGVAESDTTERLSPFTQVYTQLRRPQPADIRLGIITNTWLL